MKYKWLNKQENKNLIIFFNGWGMDESVVTHLNPENNDILMFYDYNTLETDFDFETTTGYKEVNLIAWSMGVMLGTIFAPRIKNLNKATAINGTLKPIDPEFGIHPKIYDLTIRGFNEAGREKFIKTMFDNTTPPQPSPSGEGAATRQLEEQKSELLAIKSYSANENFQYNRIFISDNDKIIPTKNQCRYWGIEPNLQSGHCPFFLFEKWSELL